MNKNPIITLILAAILLAGCGPAQSADPQALQSQINTAVAQTVESQSRIADSVASTVAALVPLSTPTLDAVPTDTPTLVAIPTLPPIVSTNTAAPVNPPSSGSGGGAPVQAEYSCSIINVRPFDLTRFKHGDDFDVKWTIVNTGTRTWEAGIDVKYYSGPKMTSVKLVEIPKKMKPGDTFQIVLDGNAPDEKGRQVMTWIVQGGLCYPYVAIEVK